MSPDGRRLTAGDKWVAWAAWTLVALVVILCAAPIIW